MLNKVFRVRIYAVFVWMFFCSISLQTSYVLCNKILIYQYLFSKSCRSLT